MKVILLQLPLQGHDFFFSHENIPLAAAYLQVIASRQRVDAELLPNHLMSYGSDHAILQFLLSAQPDLVGMSCYEWNVERSLYLAKQLRALLPSCTIVLGGPEITPDNDFLLCYRDFDIGVVGEGEEVWKTMLQSFPDVPQTPGLLLPEKNGQWHFTGYLPPRTSLDDIPSPFLSGVLDTHLKGVLWLETVRGCLYRCAYCYYHKQSPGLRTFPIERLLKEVKHAWDRGLQEIVFLDPCFSKRPHLEDLLDGVGSINHDRRLRLHGECNVEGIDSQVAEKMARAGFSQLEVGLQSVKRKTLRNIHRSFQPQRFLKAVRFLQNCGIEVMVDIIAGLPGDQLSDICRSLDWVLNHDAYDTLMLYPLSLIPSTELRRQAKKWGLIAMPHPPYLVTRTPDLTAAEMVQAFHHYEESMEEDIAPLEIPPALDPETKAFAPVRPLEASPLKAGWTSAAQGEPRANPGLQAGESRGSLPGGLSFSVDWHHPEKMGDLSHGDLTAYAFTVRMSKEVLRETKRWSKVLRDYLERNPFTLLSVEVPPDIYPENLQPLWQLAEKHSHPIDRDYTVTHSPFRSFLVFSRSQGLLWKWPDPRESSPLVLHDGQEVPCRPVCLVATSEKTIPSWFLDHIRQRYPSLPEIKQWEPPED